MQVVHKGVAHPWQCDVLGHLTTRFYVAMFDEVDEGTAVFKCTSDPPTANGTDFLTWDGLPADYYLQLVGKGRRMLRGEAPLRTNVPPLTD